MIHFNISEAINILARIPKLLKDFLSKLPENWVMNNEGIETWSPYDIVGHFIHGEKTDWIPRAKIILQSGTDKPFTPFDRFAQKRESKGKTLNDLLAEFALLRANNLAELVKLNLTADDLNKTGIHPEFGEVSLKQLLATWVVHDLGHIAQISRVMSKQFQHECGPWRKYLRIVQD